MATNQLKINYDASLIISKLFHDLKICANHSFGKRANEIEKYSFDYHMWFPQYENYSVSSEILVSRFFANDSFTSTQRYIQTNFLFETEEDFVYFASLHHLEYYERLIESYYRMMYLYKLRPIFVNIASSARFAITENYEMDLRRVQVKNRALLCVTYINYLYQEMNELIAQKQLEVIDHIIRLVDRVGNFRWVLRPIQGPNTKRKPSERNLDAWFISVEKGLRTNWAFTVFGQIICDYLFELHPINEAKVKKEVLQFESDDEDFVIGRPAVFNKKIKIF